MSSFSHPIRWFQIDVATLRTLCMQHGPLQNLQLYANHGLALIKYSSREEANKAQQALNNCPLGTSTIGAECPSDSEVQAYLQQLGTQAGSITSSAMVAPPNSSGGVTSVAQSWRQAPRTGGRCHTLSESFLRLGIGLLFPNNISLQLIVTYSFFQALTHGAPDGRRPVLELPVCSGHRSREPPNGAHLPT